MSAMAVPIATGKLDAWEAWIAELTGPRKSEFDDMNKRHGLTEHRGYLQPTPDGSFLTLAVHEGPGADEFLPGLMSSDNEFDQWFVGKLADIHGLSPDQPPPPVAQRRL